MKQRLITSAIITVGLIAVLFLSWTPVYPAVLAFFASVAVFEVLRTFRLDKKLFIAIPSYVLSAVMPCLAYIFDTFEISIIGISHTFSFLLIFALTVYIFLFYLFVVVVFERGKMKFAEASSAFISVFYIVASFSALVLMRYIDKIGLFCLGPVLISAWITDCGAYFAGYFFGKHKLIPEVSPKKTVEGAIGGVLSAVAGMMLYGLIANHITSNIEGITTVIPNYLVLALSGAILSVVSQIGDLIASVIKREHGVKDYGNIFPGHGGIMDRFDSVIAVSMITLVICLIFPPFAAA